MGLAALVQNSSAAPAQPTAAPKATPPPTGAPIPATYAPTPAPVATVPSAPKQGGLAGLVASSSSQNPLTPEQTKTIGYQYDAADAEQASKEANSSSGILRETGRDLVSKLDAPRKDIVNKVAKITNVPQNDNGTTATTRDVAQKLFPSTAETITSLGADPLSLKANPRKVLSDVWANIKATTSQQTQNLRDIHDPTKTQTVAERTGLALKTLKGFVDIGLSPITTVFTAANDIPVLSSFAKLISLPFNVVGDAGKDIGIQAVKDLPISDKAKAQLRPAVSEIFSLAAQIVAGGKIHEGVKESLVKKYGTTDAATIEAKAQEMADAHKGHEEATAAQGVTTEHPNIEKLVNQSTANDGTTVYSGRATGIEGKPDTTFHTPDLETAQKYADLNKDVTGATEVTKTDIKGKNLLEVSQEDMQKTIEDPKIREQYDGVKFQVEGEKHPTYALFEKPVTENQVETPTDQKTANVNVNEPLAAQQEVKAADRIETPLPEGEKAPSALAENTRQRAIEAGIKDDFGDLPEYNKMNMADQAKQADDLVSVDKEQAIRIAEMKEQPPEGLRAGSVYKALELRADAEGDAALALRLAQSPLSAEFSAKGQEIKSLDRGDRNTTVKIIKDVQEAKEKAAEKRGGKSPKKETEALEKQAKKAKDSVKVTKQSWGDFIEQIKCSY